MDDILYVRRSSKFGMIDFDRCGDITHHLNECPSFLLNLSRSFVHSVALHLIFLQRSLRALSYVPLHERQTTMQTFTSIVLKVISCHDGISELKFKYVLRSYVSSTDDLYWTRNLGPFVKLTTGYFLILESKGILLSYPVDWDLPFLK